MSAGETLRWSFVKVLHAYYYMNPTLLIYYQIDPSSVEKQSNINLTELDHFYLIEQKWSKLRSHAKPQIYVPRHSLPPESPLYGLLKVYKGPGKDT